MAIYYHECKKYLLALLIEKNLNYLFKSTVKSITILKILRKYHYVHTNSTTKNCVKILRDEMYAVQSTISIIKESFKKFNIL